MDDLAKSAAPRIQINRFWALWSATAVSNLADGIFKLALPLLATRLTDSPSLVAGVAFAVRLPWLLFALFAGVLADRMDRRAMIIWANMARVVVLAGLVIGVLVDGVTLPVIYLAALLLGIAETLADTASSTMLPSVVESKDLEKANAHLVGVTTLTNEFIGPPLGGALVVFSLALAFATSSALYLAAAVAVLLISGTFRPAVSAKTSIKQELISGLKWTWNHKLIRTLTLIVMVMNVGWSAWASIMVLYVVAPGPGGISEFGYGLLLTSIGIGGLLGTMIAVPLTKRFGRRWAIGMDVLGTFIMLAVPALTANVWAIGVAAVIGGIGGAMWGVVATSIRQQVVPDAMMGRVSGVIRLFGFGALPLGAVLAGFVAETAGIPAVFAVCAAMNLLLFVPFFRGITAETLAAADSK